MSAPIAKQVSAMDSLAWRIAYEWDRAKNQHKTIEQMQAVWRDGILQSANYQRLADKRKETIRFFWHQTRQQTLAHNQLYGWWFNGLFYKCWTDLPESIRYDDAKLKTLPCGHFWLGDDGKATTIRYFVSADCVGEDQSHFLPVAIATKR